MQYNFEISHLAGKKNLVADCLSRRSYDNEEDQQNQTRHDKQEAHENEVQNMTMFKTNSTQAAESVKQISHIKQAEQQNEKQPLDTKQNVEISRIQKEASINF